MEGHGGRPVPVSTAEAMFVGKAAHELRGAVGSILLLAGVVLARVEQLEATATPVADDLAVGARQLVDHSDRLDAMIGQLLDLARFSDEHDRTRRWVVDVRAAVASVLVAHPPDAARTLVVDVPHGLTLECDPLALEQILANLLLNAYRHGGAAVALHARAAEGGILVAVADDGPGPDHELLPHLFEPFTRRSVAEGSGLGLAIVAELADALGGEVAYDRAAGGGSCFRVWLPPR